MRGPAAARRIAISYAELVARFEAGAARLRAAGLARGDRCGLVARQGAGFIEHALAILAAGGCLVPIPDDAAGPARERFADAAQLHRLVAEDDGFACRAVARRAARGSRVPRARPRLPALHLGHDERAQGRRALARADRRAARRRERRRSRSAPATGSCGCCRWRITSWCRSCSTCATAPRSCCLRARSRVPCSSSPRASARRSRTRRRSTIRCSRRMRRGSGSTCGSRSRPPRGCARTSPRASARASAARSRRRSGSSRSGCPC